MKKQKCFHCGHEYEKPKIVNEFEVCPNCKIILKYDYKTK